MQSHMYVYQYGIIYILISKIHVTISSVIQSKAESTHQLLHMYTKVNSNYQQPPTSKHWAKYGQLQVKMQDDVLGVMLVVLSNMIQFGISIQKEKELFNPK